MVPACHAVADRSGAPRVPPAGLLCSSDSTPALLCLVAAVCHTPKQHSRLPRLFDCITTILASAALVAAIVLTQIASCIFGDTRAADARALRCSPTA
ncbi:hypothetical protein GQ53DRAFT_284801 [Thozetella sp. PMI_491]|nr:hypothetical protein GQ53DRAFT_284801 [Thozetella sp. PMI_491]